MKNAQLQCDICGAKESQSGKPFTAAGLGAHKKHLHPSEADEQAAQPAIEGSPSAKSQNAKGRKSDKLRKMLQAEANHVKFCPQCGFNMEVVNAAMALVNGGRGI